jgi:undecaprenyl diphosphate synthase
MLAYCDPVHGLVVQAAGTTQIAKTSMFRQHTYWSVMAQVYAFSMENWQRPEMEVNFLMQLFEQTLDKQLASLHKAVSSTHFLASASLSFLLVPASNTFSYTKSFA